MVCRINRHDLAGILILILFGSTVYFFRVIVKPQTLAVETTLGRETTR